MPKKQPTYKDLLESVNSLMLQHKDVRRGRKGIIIKATTLKKILEDAIKYQEGTKVDEGTDSTAE